MNFTLLIPNTSPPNDAGSDDDRGLVKPHLYYRQYATPDPGF